MPVQFNRSLLLAAVENVFDVAESLNPATDAFEVINPNFTPEITSQQRAVANPDLSPSRSLVTRKIGKISFDLEVKSNGNTAASIPPRIGRILRACGFSQTQINTAAGCVFRTVADNGNTGDLSFVGKTTACTRGIYLKLKCTIVSGGASGAAVAEFEAPAEATYATGGTGEIAMIDSGAVVLTDDSEVTIRDVDGNEICRVTPDFQTTNPATGDVYWIHVRPIGYLYQPISDSIPSLTLKLQFPDESGQAMTHVLTGARGTMSVSVTVGEFPVFSFEFTGSYHAATDEAALTGTFEEQDPAQVEFAALALSKRLGAKQASICAANWAIDMAVAISERDCLNRANALGGVVVTAREPTISYDPEVILNAQEPIWSYLETGVSTEWWGRHGTVNGNIVLFHAPNTQITNLGYSDRNSIRVFNIDGSLARLNGNDELQILFT